MVSMDAFASAFGLASKQGETWFTLGKVTAVNGSKLSVLMGGSATPTECEAYCIAGVGDVVLIIIKDGAPRAIATKGGVNDAAKWRDALGLGSMATESASDYLPTSDGTLTGSLTVNTDSVTISDAGGWRSALGLGSIATASDSDYLKRQPSGTSELPQDTSTGSGYPIVLSDTFANNGEISYMTAANFRALLGVSAKPTQLYNNAKGSNGTITLSSSAANYNHMRIYYKHSSDSTYSSVDVYSPNGKTVLLPIVEATTSAAWIVGRAVTISGTSISTASNWYGEQNTTTGASYNHTNYVNIVRVEGWND